MELLILSGSRAGAAFALPDVPAVVGRAAEAHLRLDDPWISSMHALLERRDREVWVVDLGSRNGTYVEDARVSESRLAPGARLRFGRTEARLEARAGEDAGLDAPGRRSGDLPRATLRSKARPEPVRAPAGAPDPFALVLRPLAVLRLGLVPPVGAPLEAPALRDALDAALAAAMGEGGRAARLAGAGLVAVFGFGGAAPEDAAHALRAARAARADVRALVPALEVRAALDHGQLYAGILAGAAGPELVALGAPVDRAEALLHLARPGELVAGPAVDPAVDPALSSAPAEAAGEAGVVRRVRLE